MDLSRAERGKALKVERSGVGESVVMVCDGELSC